MASSKNELFNQVLQERSNLFKVLGHPARLKILQFLVESKTCFTGNITDVLPLGRTTVNQHLKELKDMGLIIGNVEGAKTNYCINPLRFEQLLKAVQGFVDDFKETEFNCCK